MGINLQFFFMNIVEISIILFGLAWGSFLNVVIWRIDDLKSILWSRSRCVHCKTTIKWYDLVPVISYGILRGRCRKCREKLSILYPIIETATAILAYLVYCRFGLSWDVILLWMVFSVLIVTLGYDIIHMLIVDQVVWVGVIFAVAWQLMHLGLGDWHKLLVTLGLGAGIGVVIPLILVLLGRGKWMGEGDVMVGLLVGLLVGYPLVLVAFVLAFFIGSIYGLGLILLSRKSLKDAVPFGPFIVLGSLVALFYGQNIIDWYLTISLLK
jgi:leader peptidase (prepilin peptidase)/N-methyltransferase